MAPKSSKVKKEELYVGIASSDNTSIEYNDVSRFIGMKMPFKSPKSTFALRITSEVATFSLLQLTKVAATKITQKPLELPRGPLIRLEKHALEHVQMLPNVIFVEIDSEKYEFTYTQDANGVITLDGEIVNMELPKSALQVSLYLKSPIVDRVIALGFIGHLGRPGDPDNNLRIVSKVLRSATGINHFRALTGFESVDVPPAPRAGSVRMTKKASDRAEIMIPVWLYSADNPPLLVAEGKVTVEVNLDVPGSGNSRLLLNLTPSKEIESVFDQYRFTINETLSKFLLTHLGESELRSIAADVALGEVGAGTVIRLKDALITIPAGIDFTPNLFQPHKF